MQKLYQLQRNILANKCHMTASAPARKTQFFLSYILFEFVKLFLVAILVRNHKKIGLLTEKIFLQCKFQNIILYNLSRQKPIRVSFNYENDDFVIWAVYGLEFDV